MSELQFGKYDMSDPLHEDKDSPVPGLTHRYPDRVLMLVTDQCSMYCRHCTRRRLSGVCDHSRSREQIDACIAYIRKTPVVRDVILSGGDSFLIDDATVEYILQELRKIEHDGDYTIRHAYAGCYAATYYRRTLQHSKKVPPYIRKYAFQSSCRDYAGGDSGVCQTGRRRDSSR